MANNVVTLDVDWASKSGMADATIGFGETFDLVINGVDTLFSTIRIVLLSQSVSDETAILWTFLPETYEWTEGTVTIRNVRIYTQSVLDMLKSQGGKAKLYLSVASQAEDGHFVDYGVSKATLTIGSYLGDQPIPPSTEISGITVGELKGYVEQMFAQIRELEAGVNAAVKAAGDSAVEAGKYAAEANGVREVAVKASQDAGEAKQKAEVAEQVAKGAQYAKVFDTEAEMKAWAAAEMAKSVEDREVKVGDNLYIEELEVPDYWWTGKDDGYAQLETGAVKVKVDSELSTSSTNPVQNKVVTLELGKKAPSSHKHAVSDVNGLREELDNKADREKLNSLTTTVATKQNQLTAGENITIENNVISAIVPDFPTAVKQVRSDNLGGVNTEDESAVSALDQMNGISWQICSFADLGFRGESIAPKKITFFRRSGATDNAYTNLYLRILRWDGSAWYVAYQASTYVTHGSYEREGQRIEHTMLHKAGEQVIPATERVVLCYANAENANATAFTSFSAKVVAAPSIKGISTSGALPSSPAVEGGFMSGFNLAIDAEYESVLTVADLLDDKQDKLTAGDGIDITDGVISATGGGTSGDISIPVGGCIKFGDAQLQHYDSGEDIRFSLAGGVFCVESGVFVIGDSASFNVGGKPYTASGLNTLLSRACSAPYIESKDGLFCVKSNVDYNAYLSVDAVTGALRVSATNSNGCVVESVYCLGGGGDISLPDNMIAWGNSSGTGCTFGSEFQDSCAAAFISHRQDSNGYYHGVALKAGVLKWVDNSGNVHTETLGGSGGAAFAYADMFAATAQVDNGGKEPASVGDSEHRGQTVIGYGAYSDGENSVVLGQCSVADGNNNIIIGNDVDLRCSDRVYIGTHGDYSGVGLIDYIDSYSGCNFFQGNGAIMLNSCNASVFFASDACGATVIGGKMRDGCFAEKALEDIFNGSSGGGGDSYIKASISGSPNDIPGCSSGIAIGPYASIGNDVTNGVAIGVCVAATSSTPVVIGAGCSAITVNRNYELCVGGNPVGGGGSNDAICVYDSEVYCATGIGANYVAIGDEATAYTNAVAVGAGAYASAGEVAIGRGAGNGAVVNWFIANNSLLDVRRFRACMDTTAGNELFFATKDDKAVIGGEFGRATDEFGNSVPSLCYFYLQDVADMLANGGAEFDDAPTKDSSTKTISSDWLNRHLGYSGPVEIGKGAKGNHNYVSVDGQTSLLGGAVAIGENAVSGSYGVAIGSSAIISAGGGESVAIGRNSGSTAYSAIAIGSNAKATETTPIVIGAPSTLYQITVSAAGALCIGGQEVAKLSTMQAEVLRLVGEQYSDLDARIANLSLRVAELEGAS